MSRFKSIIFYQNSPKIKLFLKKKIAKFSSAGAPPPDPRASGSWGLCPQAPKAAPQLRISGYMRLPHFALFLIIWGFLAFVLNNFS